MNKRIFIVVILFVLISLACEVSGLDPNDERLQPPAMELMAEFNDLIGQTIFVGESEPMAPWITRINPDGNGFVVKGQSYLNNYLNSGARILLFTVLPNGDCNQTMVLSNQVGEAEMLGLRDWETYLDIKAGEIVTAVGYYIDSDGEEQLTAHGNVYVVGDGSWQPEVLSPQSGTIYEEEQTVTLQGNAPSGLCIGVYQAAGNGVGVQLDQTVVDTNSTWAIADLQLNAGDNIFMIKAIDLDDVDPLEVNYPVYVYQPPSAYDRNSRPQITDTRMNCLWTQVTPVISNFPNNRSPEAYQAVIGQFDVQYSYPGRYKGGGCGVSDTRCNIFAGDVMRAMGVPLPTKGDLGIGHGNAKNTDPMTASIKPPASVLYKWFREEHSGWDRIDVQNQDDLDAFLYHLQSGKPAIAVNKGHIAVVRPDHLPERLTSANLMELHVAQAGAKNYNDVALNEGVFGPNVVPEFYIHQ
ncbi:MAG: hypothetical protein JEZ06_03620 [Anaerolineaceae bacterium]|nr:hypothetical protein [Anaerolineaceae bacterium]